MRPRPRLPLATAALVIAGTLLAPGAGTAFTLNGASLPLAQRDFRVHDNFLDPEASDDPTQYPSFPGFTGATVAIWKGVVEWGSRPHGDGEGDPLQPGDLGSGGSNFDATFQGAASGPGDLGSNVVSAGNAAPGVLVLTEVGPDGWRMRFNEDYLWDDDGAGDLAPGAFDIQGVMTRQYGFLLGLGHSADPSAVMFGAASGTGVSLRDLAPDDAAGIQAVYGAASPAKPRIDGLAFDGVGLWILGQGFSPTSNAVWFTHDGTGGDGEPVQVSGVSSAAGGTRILVGVPAEAGPGDVLVKLDGSADESLSNAWPFDPAAPTCGHTAYGVGLGGANVGELSADGSPALGAAVEYRLDGLTGSSSALLFFSARPTSLPGLAGGTLLVDPTAVLASFPVGLTAGQGAVLLTLPASPALAGASVSAQALAADAGQVGGWAFSHGLTTTLCP